MAKNDDALIDEDLSDYEDETDDDDLELDDDENEDNGAVDEVTEHSSVAETTASPTSADLTHLADSLELQVKAQAGSVMISLQQLLTLKAGDILDIASLPPKVNLLVNDTMIASGLLVEFNGRVGVKITKLTSKHCD
jgi:flagellar motor switch/type III secretory pathway protein FliN